MKETDKKRISDYLINYKSNLVSQRKLQNAYQKFKHEIEYNIENLDSYNDVYRYLLETRFFFKEIKNGYYLPMQLEIFPTENNIKKKTIIR